MKLALATMALLLVSTVGNLLTGEVYGNSYSMLASDDGDIHDDNYDDIAEDNLSPNRYRAIVTARITAYCLRGITRSGTYTTYGTVATDRRYIAQYSRMYIDDLPGTYTSLDTGSGVLGWHVDVWMDNCESAKQWGVRYKNVYILE